MTLQQPGVHVRFQGSLFILSLSARAPTQEAEKVLERDGRADITGRLLSAIVRNCLRRGITYGKLFDFNCCLL